MKKLYLIIVLLTGNWFAYAQVTFQRKVFISEYEKPLCGLCANDGGYIAAGYAELPGTIPAAAVMAKIDSTGAFAWQKIYNTSHYSAANSIKQTADNGFIFTGQILNYAFASNYDALLVKTDSAGNYQWAKSFSAIYSERGFDTEQTNDGGYILTGDAHDPLSDTVAVFLIRTDGTGNQLWSKIFGVPEFLNAMSVKQTADGGFIMTGRAHGVGIASSDAFLLKTDSAGNIMWAKTYGEISYEIGTTVVNSPDGGYFVNGETHSFDSISKAFLLRTDSAGNTLWVKTYESVSSVAPYSMQQIAGAGFIITGTTFTYNTWSSLDAFLIKTDSTGNPLWMKTYGKPYDQEWGIAVQQSSDGGFFVPVSAADSSGLKMHLIKTDSSGSSGCLDANAVLIMDTVSFLTFPFPVQEALIPVTDTTVTIITTNGGTDSTICLSTSVNEITSTGMNVTVFPNPFTEAITISVLFDKPQQVSAAIFDLTGRLIETIPEETTPKTNFSFQWNANSVDAEASGGGIYLLKIQSEYFSITKKLLLMK